MNLIDLMNKIDAEKVFDLFVGKFSDELKTAKLGREKSFTEFVALIGEIKALKPSVRNTKADSSIMVARLRDFDGDGFCYSAFVFNGDGERYAIDMIPWDELVAIDISDKSIKLYGFDEVAAEILWDMTFWGDSAAAHKRGVNKTLKSLKKASKCKKYYSLEELEESLFKKHGILPREKKTEEQLTAEREKNQAVHEENKKILCELCGMDVIY